MLRRFLWMRWKSLKLASDLFMHLLAVILLLWIMISHLVYDINYRVSRKYNKDSFQYLTLYYLFFIFYLFRHLTVFHLVLFPRHNMYIYSIDFHRLWWCESPCHVVWSALYLTVISIDLSMLVRLVRDSLSNQTRSNYNHGMSTVASSYNTESRMGKQ